MPSHKNSTKCKECDEFVHDSNLCRKSLETKRGLITELVSVCLRCDSKAVYQASKYVVEHLTDDWDKALGIANDAAWRYSVIEHGEGFCDEDRKLLHTLAKALQDPVTSDVQRETILEEMASVGFELCGYYAQHAMLKSRNVFAAACAAYASCTRPQLFPQSIAAALAFFPPRKQHFDFELDDMPVGGIDSADDDELQLLHSTVASPTKTPSRFSTRNELCEGFLQPDSAMTYPGSKSKKKGASRIAFEGSVGTVQLFCRKGSQRVTNPKVLNLEVLVVFQGKYKITKKATSKQPVFVIVLIVVPLHFQHSPFMVQYTAFVPNTMRALKIGEKATLTGIGNIVQKSELLPMLRESGAVDKFRLYKESSQSWIQTHDDLVVRHQLHLERIAAAQTDDSNNVDEEEDGLGDMEMDSMEEAESEVDHQGRGSIKRRRKKSRTCAPRKTNMPSKKNSPPPSDPPPVSDSSPAMAQADLANGMGSLRQFFEKSLESHGKKPAPHAAPEQATEPARLLQLTNEKLAKDLEARRCSKRSDYNRHSEI